MAELGMGVDIKRLQGTSAATEAEHIDFISDLHQQDTSAKEIYFRWLARLVLLCTIVSLSFFLCSTLVIFKLAPEIVVEPLLIINQSESENMARYEPISTNMPSLRQFTEMYVKQYVIMRNTVVNDSQEMRTRWGPGGIVQYMSASDVYMDFVGENIDSVDKMFDDGYSSEVHIDEIGKDSETSPAWFVVITVYNLSKGRNSSGALTLKTKRYKISLTPKFLPQRRLLRPRLINPLGFTVLKYSQSEIRE